MPNPRYCLQFRLHPVAVVIIITIAIAMTITITITTTAKDAFPYKNGYLLEIFQTSRSQPWWKLFSSYLLTIVMIIIFMIMILIVIMIIMMIIIIFILLTMLLLARSTHWLALRRTCRRRPKINTKVLQRWNTSQDNLQMEIDILDSWGKNSQNGIFLEKEIWGFYEMGPGIRCLVWECDKLNPELLVIMDFFYISSQKVSSTPYSKTTVSVWWENNPQQWCCWCCYQFPCQSLKLSSAISSHSSLIPDSPICRQTNDEEKESV